MNTTRTCAKRGCTQPANGSRYCPDCKRRQNLATRYRITTEQYEKLHATQHGLCAGCGSPETTLHVDHDHDTGHIRGLLCGPCNRGLGLLGDNLTTLLNLANYLHVASKTT